MHYNFEASLREALRLAKPTFGPTRRGYGWRSQLPPTTKGFNDLKGHGLKK
jgi:hypothetical protein